MLNELKQEVWRANLDLPSRGLALLTWGNASGKDAESGLIAIKPSGVEYAALAADDMVIVDAEGRVVEGSLKPSSDLKTHLALYAACPQIGGVVHTHSRWATVFAQAGRNIPPLGTTHADYFFGEIPCTREMTDEEIQGEYELETGRVIVELFAGCSMMERPAALVKSHGPFTWGRSAAEAVANAIILEELAAMAWQNISALPDIRPMKAALLDRHYLRKHGAQAYYGQG